MTKEEAKVIMNNAKDIYNRVEKKLNEYQKYVEKLDSLNSSTLKLVVHLNETTATFLNGGYNDGGETFDRGVLKSTSSNLCDVSSKIANVITKTNLKIADLTNEKRQKYNEWQKAISIYNSL